MEKKVKDFGPSLEPFPMNGGEPAPEKRAERMALDDARRVKVLSPSMMVFKRFIRNKLAIVGFCILVVMFTFSFIGPLFSPYSIAQLFTKDSSEWKSYATGRYNVDPRYVVAEGKEFPAGARTEFMLAISGKGSKKPQPGDSLTFSYKGTIYTALVTDGSGEQPAFLISDSRTAAKVVAGKISEIDPEFDVPEIRDAMTALAANRANKDAVLEAGGYTFGVNRVSKVETRYEVQNEPGVLVTWDAFLALDEENKQAVEGFPFALAVTEAMAKNAPSFTLDGRTWRLEETDDEVLVYDGDAPAAMVSDIVFGTAQVGTLLSGDFLVKASEAVRAFKTNGMLFTFTDQNGAETEARINLVNGNYYVETAQVTQLMRVTEPPTSEHWLGTDMYGMDLLTRLMYGGRVSLLVGFVVVFFEMFIGVIIGGVSGYFGGWVDTALMRFVDLFNAIPYYPTIIIIGSVLDHLKVGATARLFLLMVIMGILGWTGIARVVRGQILSLREQDFMIATEATGIRTSRRIFRHLVPNVMPLLIVNATMGLGSVILAEATLGFLGLGVKYPMASWGSIINQATDMHVMTTAWWIWIPAGLLILTTVLGFNFVGDGLRDAFDPKMKR